MASWKRELMTFATCFRKIENVFGQQYDAVEFQLKTQMIERYLGQYFHDETIGDVFEGFTRMMVRLQRFSRRFVGKEDYMLSKQVYS